MTKKSKAKKIEPEVTAPAVEPVEAKEEKTTSKKKAALLCVSSVKENGKKYAPGDEYTGDNADRLIEIGVVEKA